MSEINDHIQKLVELQRLDDEIHEQEITQVSAPREVEELQAKFDILENRRNGALDKMAHLQDQKKRLSLEIDDDSAKIKKSRNKMMQVGNAREYNAMIREMDNMERSNRTREEERLTLLEALQDHEKVLDAINQEYEALKSDLDHKREHLEAIMAEARDRMEIKLRERSKYSEGIPGPIFRRYEFIRKRLEHPVIVAVDEGICSGCHIAIPPQTYIDLQQAGTQILSCPNCQRLIYWKQRFEDPDQAVAVKAGDTETEEDVVTVSLDDSDADSGEGVGDEAERE